MCTHEYRSPGKCQVYDGQPIYQTCEIHGPLIGVLAILTTCNENKSIRSLKTIYPSTLPVCLADTSIW